MTWHMCSFKRSNVALEHKGLPTPDLMGHLGQGVANDGLGAVVVTVMRCEMVVDVLSFNLAHKAFTSFTVILELLD